MRKKTGTYRNCKICKKEIYVKKCHNKVGKYRYCSRQCSGIAKRGIIPKNIKIAQANSPIKIGNTLASKNIGKKHWAWQNDNPSYRAVHAWMIKEYGKANKCENKSCIYPRKDSRGKIMLKPKSYQWANKTGKYLRDKNDFMELCASCHKKYDLKRK